MITTIVFMLFRAKLSTWWSVCLHFATTLPPLRVYPIPVGGGVSPPCVGLPTFVGHLDHLWVAPPVDLNAHIAIDTKTTKCTESCTTHYNTEQSRTSRWECGSRHLSRDRKAASTDHLLNTSDPMPMLHCWARGTLVHILVSSGSTMTPMPLSHMVQVLHLAACVMLIAGPWLVLIFPTISPMPWPDSDTRRPSLKTASLSLFIRFLELSLLCLFGSSGVQILWAMGTSRFDLFNSFLPSFFLLKCISEC